MTSLLRIGCAGWALPRDVQPEFPAAASHLARFARVFSAVEINSSFYRPHRFSTYERWADSVPEDFSFAVKVPRTITHERRLRDATALLDTFLEQVQGLGQRLGALLIQLPPSHAFDADIVNAFLRDCRQRYAGGLCVEPRHRSWFAATAESLLAAHDVSRVAADPAVVPAAVLPGGAAAPCYLRLHGSPRMYYSGYDAARLEAIAERLVRQAKKHAVSWCIFDNTAAGNAIPDALALLRHLRSVGAGSR